MGERPGILMIESLMAFIRLVFMHFHCRKGMLKLLGFFHAGQSWLFLNRYHLHGYRRIEAPISGLLGLGIKLLYDRMIPGTDPLGPDNYIAFMPGILMGTGAPCSGRFEAITKSFFISNV